MDRTARIYVAGHQGLVGAALLRRLQAERCPQLITRSHQELDLTQQAAVEAFFREARPEYVLLSAARVGGIHANSSKPADFIRDNLQIATNVIDAAWRHDVRKLLFLGSSCIYPRMAAQPMSEGALLTGPLEPTNEWYAIAKIAGLKMAQAYRRQHGFDAISLMPTNLYGPQDNFSREDSHVLPALMRRFHDARAANSPAVVIWGSGAPRREFLHVDDLAEAALFLMDRYSNEMPINVGTGTDISIRILAETIRDVVGFDGRVAFDTTRPDGAPRKLLDVSMLSALGWRAKIGLRDGIESTYRWYVANELQARR